MPEGSDVTKAKDILKHVFKKYRLTNIKVVNDEYKKLKGNLKKFNKLLPLKVTFSSAGKMMILTLENNNYVTVTFGLDGKFSFESSKNSKVKFVFENKDGKTKKLYYTDKLPYGNINLCTSSSELAKLTHLIGTDLLQSDIDDDYIINAIKKIQKTVYGKKLIIELLMHQKKLGSGIGNYLSSEILYRAKISPHRKIDSLNKKELKSLANSIRRTIKLSYLSDNSEYLSGLTPFSSNKVNEDYHSDIDLDDNDFEYIVYHKTEDPKGNTIVAEKIIPINAKKKRTTFWVPKIQK